ncbi:MAG TPA: hypothetical protein VG841_12390 [Caulobacterales bacterium]|nr:hypothetical protein [Caulobacterales bacterium]
MTARERSASEDRLANRERRAVRRIVGTLVLVAAGIAAFAAAAPWLRATIGVPMAGAVGVAFVILLIGYSEYFQVSQYRQLDEVQKTSQTFAVRWGASAGQVAFLILMFLPPAQDLATTVVSSFAAHGPAGSELRTSILVAMFLSFAALLVLQALATMVFGVIWWKRQS